MNILMIIFLLIVAILSIDLTLSIISDLRKNEKEKEFKSLAKEVPKSRRNLFNIINRLFSSKK